MAKRPERNIYYMQLAKAVEARANCKGSHVGAVLVLKDRVIATGYNGTPAGMKNCDEGGCYRCTHKKKYAPGEGYDICICVHAEQNALLTAARFGISVDGAELYTTRRPCFGCSKELLQAGVMHVYFESVWEPKKEVAEEYKKIQTFKKDWVSQVKLA